MIIAVNKIPVQNAEHARKMEQAFQQAMPGMKQFKGFLGMELWHEDNSNILAVSRWESKAALEEYTSSNLFGHHHGGASSAQASQHDHAAHGGHGHTHSGQSEQGGQSPMYYEATVLE